MCDQVLRWRLSLCVSRNLKKTATNDMFVNVLECLHVISFCISVHIPAFFNHNFYYDFKVKMNITIKNCQLGHSNCWIYHPTQKGFTYTIFILIIIYPIIYLVYFHFYFYFLAFTFLLHRYKLSQFYNLIHNDVK